MPRKPAQSNKLEIQGVRDADIPLHLVHDPARPSRESMDSDKMDELKTSIQQVGLIHPIAVKLRDSHYEVMAGHRRLIACRLLGHETIHCRIYPSDTPDSAVIQVHENQVREELNPAERANYYWRLLEEECGGDTNALAALVKLSRQHVEDILLLKTGDEDVFSALGQGLINTGVAEELNRCRDKYRRMQYLDAAVRGGATRRMIREWRSQTEAFDALQAQAPVPIHDGAEKAEPVAPPRLACELCDLGVEAGAIETMYVHKHCRRSMIDRLLRMYHQQQEQQPQ